jgi:NodT family efflux transporter outer membrane factor (OMF) lipoprotein
MRKYSPFALMLFLAACSVGPDYQEPAMDIPQQWGNDIKDNTAIKEQLEWWQSYNDPLLNELISEASLSNLDLKAAFARIREARASLSSAEASLYPQINASGSYSHNENSLNTPVTSSQNRPSSASTNRYFDLYKVGLDASWEIDLFGRLRRAEEAASAILDAQIEDGHATFLTLIADIAQNYITLRGAQQQLEITQNFYNAWNHIYQLNQDLYKAGLATDIDVAQAKSYRDQAKANLSPLESTLKNSIHNLSVLSGKNPTALYSRLTEKKPLPRVPAEIFTGLPSDLLKRRPDIRKAERDLAAATAQIGLAVGDLFPKFSLTGTIGYQSNKGSNLIAPRSSFYSFGPGFSWPIIDFGRIQSAIEAKTAARDESFFLYEKAVLSAFKDVENALVNYAQETERSTNLTLSFEASKNAADISMARYKSGLLSFINVLQAETTYHTNALAKVQSEVTLLLNTVTLYKALGGGWQMNSLQTK